MDTTQTIVLMTAFLILFAYSLRLASKLDTMTVRYEDAEQEVDRLEHRVAHLEYTNFNMEHMITLLAQPSSAIREASPLVDQLADETNTTKEG